MDAQQKMFDIEENIALSRDNFSHERVCSEFERLDLEKQYKKYLQKTEKHNRQKVSFQGNKGEIVHSWIKYKEGFSSELVEDFISYLGINEGDWILEPFSGSATTLLVSLNRGINAIGFEILPNCQLMWEAKSIVYTYDVLELNKIMKIIQEMEIGQSENKFPHLVITESAFPKNTENQIMFISEFINNSNFSSNTKTLLKLVIISVLENVSYTRKDGQYLRWDARSEKIKSRNIKRMANGKKQIKGLHKGYLADFRDALIKQLKLIIEDIKIIQKTELKGSEQTLIRENVLFGLPKQPDNKYDGVITSPPYCNRYDYTRSYALELAYLGIGEKDIRQLRQEQLTCTVESKSKEKHLKQVYESIGELERYDEIYNKINNLKVLSEIKEALEIRWERGEINNKGILTMVEGYFIELGFVIAEMYRTLKNGASVVIVNDNVRYGGEIIPVDLISTKIGELFGFDPVKVFVLPQRKGNSSQQMKKFGRQALRKSITVWRKKVG